MNSSKCSQVEIQYIVKKEDGVYIVECIDLNIVTQGDTLKEAKKNIQEAITLHLESARKLNILDKELEKLGVVRKNHKLLTTKRELDSAPVMIPC